MLCLYGYSNQLADGLSFPDDVTDPDVGCVAAVTLEVMSLRIELEMLIKVCVCVLCIAIELQGQGLSTVALKCKTQMDLRHLRGSSRVRPLL